MAQNSLTLKDDTPTSSTYNLISLSGSEAVYRDAASDIGEPRTLRISHSTTKEADGTDRHLVQLSRTDDNGDAIPYTGTIHVVIAFPRDGVSSANMLLEWEKLKNCVDVSISELLGGFMPSAGAA